MFGQREANNTDMAVPSLQPTSAPAVPAPDVAASVTDADLSQLSDIGATLPTSPIPAPAFSSSALESPGPMPAPAPSITPVAFSTPAAPAPSGDGGTADDLVRMKQEALQHLQPLVDTLQQTPEEEFRTLMMMIQATDDKTMLKKALESAKKIKDSKVRAQAMLDVINEINYFTQTSTQE